MAEEGLGDLAKLNKPADDTPAEFSFVWRRSVGIGWLIVNALFLAWIVALLARFGDAEPASAIRALMWVSISLIVSNAFMALLYYAGASAVDIGLIAKGIAQAKSRRSSYDGYSSYDHIDDPEPTPSKPDGEGS